jgi:cytochrome c553
MKHLLILLAAAALPMAAGADDSVAKPDKVATCAACHGENGVSTAGMYPNLAGQYSNYIEQALHAYKGGKRKNAIMNGQAANLSDQDIKELAAWFSHQKPVLYTPEPNAKAGE